MKQWDVLKREAVDYMAFGNNENCRKAYKLIDRGNSVIVIGALVLVYGVIANRKGTNLLGHITIASPNSDESLENIRKLFDNLLSKASE